MDIPHELLQNMQNQYASLTRGLQKVAKYISDNPVHSSLLSAQNLAAEAGVSEATVIRFAQKLGYSGYHELKADLQRGMLEKATSSQRIKEAVSQLSKEHSITDEIIHTHGEALRQLGNSLNPHTLNQVAKWIINADSVYSFGEGAASVPAIELAFWLNRFGKRVKVMSETGRNLFESIANFSSGDVVIGFGFRVSNPDLEIVFKEMRLAGGKCVLVTDRVLSPLMAISDEVIVIKRGNVGQFRSMAVPILVVEAISLAVVREQPAALERMRHLENLREKYEYE